MSSSSLRYDWLRQLLLRRLRRTEITAVNLPKMISVNMPMMMMTVMEETMMVDTLMVVEEVMLIGGFHLFAFGDKDQSCETA